jgi:hypothetical protein
VYASRRVKIATPGMMSATIPIVFMRQRAAFAWWTPIPVRP